jgi:hypothetical protein
MSTPYVAYGLQLEASFELPGMVSSTLKGLPVLRVDLIEPAALDGVWSAGDASEEWVGCLGDGRELRIDRGVGGDRLFTYAGGEAHFHLDADAKSLACAPEQAGLDWLRVLLTKVISAVSVMRGYEALHAAGLDTPAGAVAIAAPSGMGKTTLALELIGRGWTLLSDDVLVLSSGPSGVAAHPGTAHMNLAAQTSDATLERLRGERIAMLSGEQWVSVRPLASRSRPVRAVFMLERARELRLGVQELPRSPIPLIPYVLGVGANEDRRRKRFALYGEMMCSADLVRLTCGAREDPAVVADLVETTLAQPGPLSRSSELA